MNKVTDLPNIGKTLAEKLKYVVINSKKELVQIGSENIIIKIATIEDGWINRNIL